MIYARRIVNWPASSEKLLYLFFSPLLWMENWKVGLGIRFSIFHPRARGWKIFLEAYNKSRTGREATDHEWAKTRVGKVYSRNFINSLGLDQGLLPMSRQAFDIDRLRLRYYIRSRANFVEARGREGLIKKYTGVITRKHGETVCGACIYIYVHVRPWIGWRIIHGV